MKYLFYIPLIITLLSCGGKQEPLIISVLEDQTEEDISHFNPSDIHKGFEVDENQWLGYSYRYQSLTGSDYNKIKEAKLEAENQLFGNSLEREKKVKQFKALIESSQINNQEEHTSSSIFLPLVTEIEYLHTHYPTSSCTILLYSDLRDHNDWISWYHSSTKNNEKTKRKYLVHLPKIAEGNKIELRIIYTPTPNENKQFREIISLYESLCKQMHIGFSVGASL
jgi:hypothetical protein